MKKQFNVKDGDMMTCSFGSQGCCISVPLCHGNVIQGKNGATVNDCKAGVNISSFGICNKSYPYPPCTPIILTTWLMGNAGFEVNGEVTLLNDSVLSCACGGIIKIKS